MKKQISNSAYSSLSSIFFALIKILSDFSFNVQIEYKLCYKKS